MYFWAHSSRFFLCLSFKGGRILALAHLASLLGIRHLEVLGIPDTPAPSNTPLLDCKGFRLTPLFIKLIIMIALFIHLKIKNTMDLQLE